MVGTERAIKAAAAEGLPICLLISKFDRWAAQFSGVWARWKQAWDGQTWSWHVAGSCTARCLQTHALLGAPSRQQLAPPPTQPYPTHPPTAALCPGAAG